MVSTTAPGEENKNKLNNTSCITSEEMKHIALAELVSFIEEAGDETTTKVFKLSELTQDYCSRLEQVGAKPKERIHTTRLNE